MLRGKIWLFLVILTVFFSTFVFSKNVYAISDNVNTIENRIDSHNPFTRCTGEKELSVDTALGCIPVDMKGFIGWLLPWFFGVAGGISFFLMIFGFIKITTSQGDPKVAQGGKETITSAVVGLVISILSIFLIRLILVGILKIPGIE